MRRHPAGEPCGGGTGQSWALYNQSRATQQAELARTAESQAVRLAHVARVQALKAQQAPDDSEALLEKLTNSNRLKQAFLQGDVATIQRLAQTTGDDPQLRFVMRKGPPKGWRTPDGRDVRQWDLLPAPENLPALLRSASQISYYMNHRSFNVKLLSAGAGSSFAASYTGWGCLDVVYVLIEYFEADKPPRLIKYDQCASVIP